MKMSLHPTELDRLKCGQGESLKEVFDAMTPGLRIRVTANKKSWTYFFTVPGSKVRAQMPLGTYPATTLSVARQRAMDARGHVEAGIDPRTVQAVPKADMTISQLIDLRVRSELRRDASNFKWTCMEIERSYDQDVIPVVGDVPVKDFRIRHLKQVLRPILERGCNTQANRVHQHMGALLAFAVREGEIELDPLSAAKPPSKETVKDRWLSLTEIKTLWNTLDSAMARSDLVPDILRLILATGQRPGEECAAVERSEIDWTNRLWTIPAHKAKNKHAHVVPLNDLAMTILERRRAATNSRWLFPNNEGDGPIPNYTVAGTTAKALASGRLGIAKFTPHDLRRSVATHMSLEENGLQIPELYISHVLNHRSMTHRGVTARVYNQNTYLAEKRAALVDKWGAFLAALVAPAQQREAA